MQVRETEPYPVHSQDTELVYQALIHYRDDLIKLKTWVERYHGDTGSAVSNIEEEIDVYTKLILDMYEKCFNTARLTRVTRTRTFTR